MNTNFVIVGLPASGKTTFLAALWHIIEADETKCQLRLGNYEGDLQYLNAISEAWRTFTEVPRTSQVGDVDIAIQLVNIETNVAGLAFFPDLAGETFDIQVESRQCRPKFVQNVESDDGILLFISVNAKQDGLSIVELNSMIPPDADNSVGDVDFVGEVEEKPAVEKSAVGKVKKQTELIVEEWAPKRVPTQVRLVQILSDLVRPPFLPRKRRLAVILSAWDLVQKSGLSPEKWLEANMPLLDQFLRTNPEFFAPMIYGVSAQGVSLLDQEAVDLVAKLPPSHRISVVGPKGNTQDITIPLVWLMSES